MNVNRSSFYKWRKRRMNPTERQKQRDLDDSRHLGHILTSYHRSDSKIERKNADNLLDYTEFYKRCTQRGYGEFELGDTIEVDVSDYEKIEYPKILQWLEDRV